MACLFKLKITRYVDESGRRVTKATPGAKRVAERSKKWYGDYKDAEGTLRRVPLSSDKAASQAMLNELVLKSERRSAGLTDPFEEHAARPLEQHIDDYGQYLRAKNGTEGHVRQVVYRIREISRHCKFVKLGDIDATKVATWLADRRNTSRRFSAQTSNHYCDAFKHFCNWLTVHGRIPKSPVAMLRRVNVAVDRRHDRRCLTDEEFQRLIAAAESGRVVEGMTGIDRAMMYIVAVWTGYRRREISSLRRTSIDISGPTPSIRLSADFSKRRKLDAIPLHPFVVEKLTKWMETKVDLGFDEPLFPLQTAKGFFRKTAKMMQFDLERARQAWLAEADTEEERAKRSATGFLAYRDERGLFADFHANRHTFISNLSRAGVPLAMAQKLARHSDPRLTANRYTHLELDSQAAAINAIPSPVPLAGLRASGPHQESLGEVGKSLVAVPVAGTSVSGRPLLTPPGSELSSESPLDSPRKSLNDKTFGNDCHQKSNPDQVHPSGLEPLTFGSVGELIRLETVAEDLL